MVNGLYLGADLTPVPLLSKRLRLKSLAKSCITKEKSTLAAIVCFFPNLFMAVLEIEFLDSDNNSYTVTKQPVSIDNVDTDSLLGGLLYLLILVSLQAS